MSNILRLLSGRIRINLGFELDLIPVGTSVGLSKWGGNLSARMPNSIPWLRWTGSGMGISVIIVFEIWKPYIWPDVLPREWLGFELSAQTDKFEDCERSN